MSTITSLVDTLLPQVLGRRGDIERVNNQFLDLPLVAVRSPNEELPSPTPGNPQASRHASAQRAAAAPTPEATVPAGTPVASEGGEPASIQLHLSRTADLLSSLLLRPDSTTRPVHSTESIFSAQAPMPSTASIAQRLANVVSHSGLFYESHIARSINGRYAVEALAGEARDRLESSTGEHKAEPDPGPGGHADGGVFDARLSPGLRAQMDLLASGVFRWQGEAWPGSEMQWSVEDRERSEAGADQDDARHISDLSLSMAALGDIRMSVRMGTAGLAVRVWSENADTRDLMAADLATLSGRLRQLGLARATAALVPPEAS